MSVILGNQIRPGNIIIFKGELCRVVKTQATKTGKGGAYAQVELVSIKKGTKYNHRFGAGETVDQAHLQEAKATYTYSLPQGENTLLVFLTTDTHEQVELPQSFLGEAACFLKDGLEVSLLMYQEEVISVRFPKESIETIAEAEPVLKGQTATSSYKPAVLENGLKVNVPPHIKQGDQVVINTETWEYLGVHKKA